MSDSEFLRMVLGKTGIGGREGRMSLCFEADELARFNDMANRIDVLLSVCKSILGDYRSYVDDRRNVVVEKYLIEELKGAVEKMPGAFINGQ